MRDNSMQVKMMAEAKYKFHSEEELQSLIDGYFAECKAENKIPTEHGMALALGVLQNTLKRWVSDNTCPETIQPYMETLRMAYDRLADEYQQLLLTGEKNMTSFVIFALKQKQLGGYQDRIENKNETTIKVKFGDSIENSDFR